MVSAPQLSDGWLLEPSDSPEYVASIPMSFEEYLRWDHEGGLVEWIDGMAYVYVSATFEHQPVVGFLSSLLRTWAELTKAGSVLTAPYAMQSIAGGAGREPDIVFVRAGGRGLIQSKFLAGSPDLIVEVVSPDSVARDRGEKRREYAAAGVREYWIVDVRPNVRRVDFLVLEDGEYVEREPDDGVYRSVAAEGFWVRPAWLWEFGSEVIPALVEILGRPVFPDA